MIHYKFDFKQFRRRNRLQAFALEAGGLESNVVLREAFDTLPWANDSSESERESEHASETAHALNDEEFYLETSHVMNTCVSMTQDEAFPAVLANFVNLTQAGSVGVSVMTSRNLSQAFEKYNQFSQLVFPYINFDVKMENELTEVIPVEEGLPAHIQANQYIREFSLTGLVSLMRSMIDAEYKPVSIHLMRRHDALVESVYSEFFSCPIHFDEQKTYLLGEGSALFEPLLSSNHSLEKMTEEICRKELERLYPASFSDKVKHLVLENLSSGKAKKELIASTLNMSTKSLQDKLTQEGTGFKEILEKVRFDLASDLLINESQTVESVALHLGYTDISNFSRAFKKWSGVSPREFVQGSQKN